MFPEAPGARLGIRVGAHLAESAMHARSPAAGGLKQEDIDGSPSPKGGDRALSDQCSSDRLDRCWPPERSPLPRGQRRHDQERNVCPAPKAIGENATVVTLDDKMNSGGSQEGHQQFHLHVGRPDDALQRPRLRRRERLGLVDGAEQERASAAGGARSASATCCRARRRRATSIHSLRRPRRTGNGRRPARTS